MRTTLKRLSAVVFSLAMIGLVIALAAPAASAATVSLVSLAGIVGATNTFGNYNETFFAQEALIQLEKVLGMAGRVHRGYSETSKRQGDTIQIRRPSTFTAQDAPSTSQDLNTESLSITLNKWKEVKFEILDKDLSLTSDQIITNHIRPAAVALADKIDQDLCALYTDIPWYATMSATPIPSDLGKLRKVMFDNKVPLNDKSNLSAMLDGTTELAYLVAMSAAGQQANVQDPSLREGSIGRLMGYDTWANQNAPTHTSGTAADAAGTVTGAHAKGATSLVVAGMTAAAPIKKGDIITIAGHTQQYTVAADVTLDGAGAGTLTLSDALGLRAAVSNGTVVTLFLGGASKSQTLAFHKNAFALATAPLTEMGHGRGADIATVTDPISNLSLRSRIFYVGNESKLYVALDILYGYKTIDPNLAVRGYQA